MGPVYTRDKNEEKIPGYTRVRRLSIFPDLHLSKKNGRHGVWAKSLRQPGKKLSISLITGYIITLRL